MMTDCAVLKNDGRNVLREREAARGRGDEHICGFAAGRAATVPEQGGSDDENWREEFQNAQSSERSDARQCAAQVQVNKKRDPVGRVPLVDFGSALVAILTTTATATATAVFTTGASPTTATATASTRTFFTRAGDVDREGATIHFLAV